jgi:hypothetical protein
MDDHGLCIAGIIRSIAPEAKLHMVEVLNRHGVGTLGSVAWAFEMLTQRLEGLTAEERKSHYIVNMSFQYDLPTLAEVGSFLDDLLLHAAEPLTKKQEEQLRKLKLDHHEFHTQGEAAVELRELFEAYENVKINLNTLGTTATRLGIHLELIAAGGNDLLESSPFPAHQGIVRGIGALKIFGVGKTSRGKPTRYSRRADTQGAFQIWAPGGDFDPKDPDDVADRILGLSSQPPFCRWWVGTSFAAAMFTGALAQYISQQPKGSDGKAMMQAFLDSDSFKKPAEKTYYLDAALPWK